MAHESAARSPQPPEAQTSARETERQALLEAARRLSEAQKSPDDTAGLVAAARLNWRLWTIFQSEISAPNCPLPVEVRTNMLNLCNFVDKQTVALLDDPKPERANALISINHQLAGGLEGQSSP